jgi:membrane-bound serine protease (ClpP class)
MKKLILITSIFLSFFTSVYSKEIVVVKVKGVINPIIGNYIERGIKEAEEIRAECVIIELNTPGGLDKSMREIVEAMLSSYVPTVVFVYPPGARAASAGVFIGVAANILAMAPTTNIGAAHPVDLTGKLSKEISEKIANDAAAYIKSIAEKRGKNVFWVEKAVKESKSITAEEAVKLKVADLIAKDLEDLIKKIDGKEVKGIFGTKKLNTKNAKIKRIDLKFHQKFLHDISDPNVAYVLLMIGIYGMIYELANPGATLPGVIGGICLLLAFFALESLPINLVGILLILLGIGFFIAELKTPGFGALATGGAISLFLGSLMLFSSSGPYFAPRVSLSLIITFVAFTTIFFLVALSYGIRALKTKIVSGKEGLVGKIGITKETLNPYGIVLVEGEDWSAESEDGVIEKNEKIEVTKVEGLKLKVKKLKEVK